jgi:hypothetical protein
MPAWIQGAGGVVEGAQNRLVFVQLRQQVVAAAPGGELMSCRQRPPVACELLGAEEFVPQRRFARPWPWA